MKLSINMFISLDGVVQAPGGPTEDPSDGFDLGGWLPPLVDEEFGVAVEEIFSHADAFLLGRRTYEIMAAFWPQVTDADDPVAAKLNGLTKYVPTSTLTQPVWSNTNLASGDLMELVVGLKDMAGDEVQVHGSGRLARSLHDLGVVDLYRLFIFPVVLGKGRRLFSDGAAPTGFALDDHAITSTGVSVATFVPTGPARTGDITLEDGVEVLH